MFSKFKFLNYIVRFLIAIISLYILSSFIDVRGSLIYAIAVAVTACIIALNMGATITARKKAAIHKYDKEGQFYAFLTKRTFSYIFAVIISLILSFFILVKIYVSSNFEKVLLLIAIPIYVISMFIAKKVVHKVYDGEFRVNEIKRFTYGLSSLLFGIIYPLMEYFGGGFRSKFVSLKDIVHVALYTLVPLNHNPIAYVIGYFISLSDSFSIFILQAFAKGPIYMTVAVIVVIAGNGLFFYGIINYIASFMLKKNEIYCVFTPIYKKTGILSVNKFMTGFIFVVVVFFIYPSVFVEIQRHVELKSLVFRYLKEKSKTAVEIIDGIAYKVGTLRQIEEAKATLYGKSRYELEMAVNRTYDEMESKVDKYLDWYYSLGAEYTRIFKLLTGSIDDYMKAKLVETISPTENLSGVFMRVAQEAGNVENQVNKILEDNKVDTRKGEYRVIINTKLQDIFSKSQVDNFIGLKKRLFVSTGVSLAAGTIAATAASKIAAKTAFKTATKAAAKLALEKGAGAAVGVAAGAISGIFTSPIGGAVIGTAAGVAMDKGMLRLEEAVNRENYKKEIISSIEESRKDMLDKIYKAINEDDNGK